MEFFTGAFLAHATFAEVYQEQREYVYRHDVLPDRIPILLPNVSSTTTRPQVLMRSPGP